MRTRLFRFPHPVNEVAARLVAAGVFLMAAAIVGLHAWWLLGPLAYGFMARVLAGPTLSPLGQIVTRGIVPRLPARPKYVPGPPKRFAQGVGALFSGAALVLAFGFGQDGAAAVLIGILAVCAFLEAAFAFCVGCKVFALLMRLRLIPEEVCVECADIWSRSSRMA
jgi:hypothetical protein